ncbi:orf4b [Betacoronavirus Erinaceus/VMC/DEU/2012]|uniref:Orf4b n=1 Tax=Betacoronavirus Erinaceus/VMC/DEU/2012 TaxID=1385427 RepID=U5LNP0_9BETC|nr:orf4b [Betacoronavirus Erinaceus/VMC/DEU/2012]
MMDCSALTQSNEIRNRRYHKRRFSPVRASDLQVAKQPTHYLRITFPPTRQWTVRRGLTMEDVETWLYNYDAKPVTQYHITLALLVLDKDESIPDITNFANMFRRVRFELKDFNVLGRTLVLNATELVCENPYQYDLSNLQEKVVPCIKQLLSLQRYKLHDSGLPLHLSVSKLHDLEPEYRSHISNVVSYRPTCFVAKPTSVELVTTRAFNGDTPKVVMSVPIY